MIRALSIFLLSSFPIFSHAATGATFRSVVGDVTDMIAYVIPLLIGIALVVFFWGMVTFIAQSGDEQAVSKGKQRMVWGIIGIFVMVAVWGIVNFALDTLGFTNSPMDLNDVKPKIDLVGD